MWIVSEDEKTPFLSSQWILAEGRETERKEGRGVCMFQWP